MHFKLVAQTRVSFCGLLQKWSEYELQPDAVNGPLEQHVSPCLLFTKTF